MTLALASLPYLDRRLYEQSFLSVDPSVMTVRPWDNTCGNAGVTRPWNETAHEVLVCGWEWLVVWSTAIVFGPTRGADFAAALDRAECYRDHPGVPRIVSGIGCGWHLTAIHRTVLERVGNFDPIFFAYYGDSDFIYRHRLAGLGDLWADGNVQVPVDLAVNRGDAHSLHRGLVTLDLGADTDRYLAKWGGHPRRERFTRPYNRSLDWTHTGEPT